MRRLMSHITEAQFTNQVLELAKLRGWRTAHFRPARTATGWRTAVQGDGKGWPDVVLVRRSRMIVAELKRDRKARLTKDQEAWLLALRLVGMGVIEVQVWTPEDWGSIEEMLA